VRLGGNFEKCGLKRIRVDPRPARLAKEGKIIHDRNRSRYALKLSPHEHDAAAFGFLTLNPPSCSASTKSNSLPVT